MCLFFCYILSVSLYKYLILSNMLKGHYSSIALALQPLWHICCIIYLCVKYACSNSELRKRNRNVLRNNWIVKWIEVITKSIQGRRRYYDLDLTKAIYSIGIFSAIDTNALNGSVIVVINQLLKIILNMNHYNSHFFVYRVRKKKDSKNSLKSLEMKLIRIIKLIFKHKGNISSKISFKKL